MYFKKIIIPTFRLISYALLIFIFLFGGGYFIVQHDGNVHVVEEGKVYRSAQLDKSSLRDVISRNGIKSILNLRGNNTGHDWYDNEIEVSSLLGVEHIDHGISANRRVPIQEMKQLLQQIERAPKPILIHCKAGADRTGLVSALYLARSGRPTEQVKGQLSFIYGHIPILIHSDKIAMDKSLDEYLTHMK